MASSSERPPDGVQILRRIIPESEEAGGTLLSTTDDSSTINRDIHYADLERQETHEEGVAKNDTGRVAPPSSDLVEAAQSAARQLVTNAIPPPESALTEISVTARSVGAKARNPLPQVQKHIMISYSRSCSVQCERIRKYLEWKGYVVWMDVTRLRGNFIESLANAITNSYVVVMCLNQAYPHSFWCKLEAQFLQRKNVACIPCWMETPFSLDPWLESVVGSNNCVDFSTNDSFEVKMAKLIDEITEREEGLAHTPPRRNVPGSPVDDLPTTFASNPSELTRGEFDYIIETFEQWVELNRDVLRRTDRTQVQQFVDELLHSLRSDADFKKLTKDEFLDNLSRFVNRSAESAGNADRVMNMGADSMITGVVYFLMNWALRKIYTP